MEIKRDKYLNDLLNRMHNGMIKVVTGIRRCGKSYLLSHNHHFKWWLSERLKQNQLFALALYITVTKLHVNSRRVIRLFFCFFSAFFYYSGKRPSYMILSSP